MQIFAERNVQLVGLFFFFFPLLGLLKCLGRSKTLARLDDSFSLTRESARIYDMLEILRRLAGWLVGWCRRLGGICYCAEPRRTFCLLVCLFVCPFCWFHTEHQSLQVHG